MKKWLTKVLSLSILCLPILSPGWAAASSEDPFTIIVDGTHAATPLINQDGRLLVPAVFFQRMGVSVKWNPSDQAVQLEHNNIQLSLPSGEKTAYSYINGNQVPKQESLTTTTLDKQDGTYIPLRFAAEKFGMGIAYDAKTSVIRVQTRATEKVSSAENEEIYWLYQITEAEASGESHEGKVAVAASILNRVESPDFPNSIKEVIFQVFRKNGVDHYQFSPVKDKRIYTVTPSSDTISAVQEALQGADPTNGAVVFYNPKKTDNAWVRSQTVKKVIGNHVFAAR